MKEGKGICGDCDPDHYLILNDYPSSAERKGNKKVRILQREGQHWRFLFVHPIHSIYIDFTYKDKKISKNKTMLSEL